MPRQFTNFLNMRAPFGGLIRNPSNGRALEPRNCQGCLNVHTANGVIEVRKGYSAVSPLSGDLAAIMRGARLKNTDYVAYSGIVTFGLVDAVSGTLVSSNLRIADSLGPSIVQFNSVVYYPMGPMVLGGKSFKIYSNSAGALLVGYIGHPAPTAAPTIGGTGAGVLPAGTWSYRYTYYNSNIGTESSPSAQVTQALGGLGSITVNVTASGYAEITNIRIYRKLQGTDSTWFFVAQVANATAGYLDNNYPIGRTSEDALNVTDGIPPNSYMCFKYGDRMLWRDDSNLYSSTPIASTTLVVSEANAPELVNPLNTFRFGNAQNDGIVGGIEAFGGALVLCKNSAWILNGLGPSSYTRDKIASVGCEHADTIRADPETGHIYWANLNGAYRFDGASVQCISRKIWPEFNARTYTSAGFDIRTGLYLITSNTDYITHAYDPKTGNWFRWNLSAYSFSTQDTYKNRLYFGHSAGGLKLYRGTSEQTTDAGSGIFWSWATPQIDVGTLQDKNIKYVNAAIGPKTSSGETTTLEYRLNDGDGALTSAGAKSRNVTPSTATWTLDRRCNSIELTLSGTSVAGAEIAAIELEGEVVGQ